MQYMHGKLTFVQAESEELKKATYRLRYQVYVEEYGFLPAEDNPGGLEMDDHEPYSIHLAALDEAKQVVGTIRLVLHSEKGFPIEHATKLNFIGEKPPPQQIAEISRLAVIREFRRRKDNGMYGVESYVKTSQDGVLFELDEMPEPHERRQKPAIVLGLCRLMYQVSKRLGLTHWYIITEKKVCYALRRYGFLFHQIGEPVEYHGVRIPYLGIIEEIENNLISTNPDFFGIILMGLEEEYRPKMVDTGKAE